MLVYVFHLLAGAVELPMDLYYTTISFSKVGEGEYFLNFYSNSVTVLTT